jgi:hypothetical protein
MTQPSVITTRAPVNFPPTGIVGPTQPPAPVQCIQDSQTLTSFWGVGFGGDTVHFNCFTATAWSGWALSRLESVCAGLAPYGMSHGVGCFPGS